MGFIRFLKNKKIKLGDIVEIIASRSELMSKGVLHPDMTTGTRLQVRKIRHLHPTITVLGVELADTPAEQIDDRLLYWVDIENVKKIK